MQELRVKNDFESGGPKLKVTTGNNTKSEISPGGNKVYDMGSNDCLTIQLGGNNKSGTQQITVNSTVSCSLMVPNTSGYPPPDSIKTLPYYKGGTWTIDPNDPQKKRDGWVLTVRTLDATVQRCDGDGDSDEKDDVSIGPPPPDGGQNEDNQEGANN